jgi:hypothetical protein
MINNLNDMRIKKFNEAHDLEKFNIFQDDEDQSLISKDILEDYFSIFESDYEISIELGVIKDSGQYCFYLNTVEKEVMYEGEIIYNIELYPKNIDRTYAIDHGDYATELFDIDSMMLFNKYMNNIKSIKNKLNSHNHNILIGFDGLSIICIVRNKQNEDKL